jgi:hypothetical protein
LITLRFIRGRGLLSALIAWFGGGEYSHVDYLMPDGTWLGARSDRIGGAPPGVQIRPADYVKPVSSLTLSLQTTPEQDRDHYAFLYSQEGKPYDKWAIFGFIAGRNWRNPGAWICSELQCAAAESADIMQPLVLTANRITPNDLALVWSALGAKVSKPAGVLPQ